MCDYSLAKDNRLAGWSETGKRMIGKIDEKTSREDTDRFLQMSKEYEDTCVPYKCSSKGDFTEDK